MLRLLKHEVSNYFTNMGQIHIFNQSTNQPFNQLNQSTNQPIIYI